MQTSFLRLFLKHTEWAPGKENPAHMSVTPFRLPPTVLHFDVVVIQSNWNVLEMII